MKNIFKYRINDISELEVIHNEDTVEVLFDSLTILDTYHAVTWNDDTAQDVINFYNETLWNNYELLCLMARYTHHIKSYNEEGWKRRGDFTTPETYKAFIKGIEYSIRFLILDIMHKEFIGITPIYKLQPEVFERMDNLLSKWTNTKQSLPHTAGVYAVKYGTDEGSFVTACYFDGTDTWYHDVGINHDRVCTNKVIMWKPLSNGG